MNLFQDGGVLWLMGLAGSGKSTLSGDRSNKGFGD